MLPFRRPPATSKFLSAAASVPTTTDPPADPATHDPATPLAAANRDSSPHVDYDLYPLGIHEFDHYIGPAPGNKRFHVH